MMNIFDVIQYMTDNNVKGIELTENKETVTIHQFLNNGEVLQTITTQTVLTSKKAKT